MCSNLYHNISYNALYGLQIFYLYYFIVTIWSRIYIPYFGFFVFVWLYHRLYERLYYIHIICDYTMIRNNFFLGTVISHNRMHKKLLFFNLVVHKNPHSEWMASILRCSRNIKHRWHICWKPQMIFKVDSKRRNINFIALRFFKGTCSQWTLRDGISYCSDLFSRCFRCPWYKH